MTENNQSGEVVETDDLSAKKNILKTIFNLVWKVIYYGVLAVVIFLLFFNVYSIFANKVLDQQVPKMFGYAYQLVLTDSMKGDNPDSFPGHTLIVIKEQDDYEINDVITFSTDSAITTTHRIVDEKDGEFITKGDFNNTTDRDPVPMEDIHGKVIWKSLFLGKLLVFVRQPIGLILLLVVGFALCYFPGMFSKKEGQRHKY